MCDSFRRKEFESCNLFRNLLLIPTIAESPASHLKDDKNGISTFNTSVEMNGYGRGLKRHPKPYQFSYVEIHFQGRVFE